MYMGIYAISLVKSLIVYKYMQTVHNILCNTYIIYIIYVNYDYIILRKK